MKSTPFAIWYCRRAFVAVATILFSSTHALSAPVLKMPIFTELVQFKGMPGPSYFTSLGMKPVPDCLHRNRAGGLPDQASVNADVAAVTALDPAPIVCVDLENLPVDIRKSTTAQVDATIAYFRQIINWVRIANPKAKVGFYAVVPIGDYWTPNLYYTALRFPNDPWWRAHLTEFQKNYQAWLAANAYWASFAQQVDVLFPSLYASYDNYEDLTNHGWPTFARTTIAEARKYRKPVYPYLWPQRHDTSSYWPEAYWQAMLRQVRLYADGIFVWNAGSFHNESWNPNAFWWQDVLSLANSLSAPGALGGHIELAATPPDGVYPSSSVQHVSLAAAGSTSIRYSLTTAWPSTAYPTCSTGTIYTSPINVSRSEIILATACYPDGSSMNANFAYVLT